jgi:hypothetical protein
LISGDICILAAAGGSSRDARDVKERRCGMVEANTQNSDERLYLDDLFLRDRFNNRRKCGVVAFQWLNPTRRSS